MRETPADRHLGPGSAFAPARRDAGRASELRVDPHLVTNPADDDEFRGFANRVLRRDPHLGAFWLALRERYPAAVVHERSLSGEPWLVWYVYRDGHWVGRSGQPGGDA